MTIHIGPYRGKIPRTHGRKYEPRRASGAIRLHAESPVTRRPAPLLERLGLHRPELRAWAMYDWAISAFKRRSPSPSFRSISCRSPARSDGTIAAQRSASPTSIAIAIVAVLSPILGTIADYSAAKKRMLGVFLASAWRRARAMYFIYRGDCMLATVLFVARLRRRPRRAPCSTRRCCRTSRVRTRWIACRAPGYAIGYLGGGVLLAFNLAWIMRREGSACRRRRPPAAQTLPVRLALRRWPCGGCCSRSRCSAACPSRRACSRR